MASIITVRLNKLDAPSWGFRLQGGKDFGTPLVIQKVNGGSPAEKAGLIAGDSVIKINNVDVFNLRHKDAQDVVVRSGPSFEMTVQRGGSTWKPSVVPTGSVPAPSPVINSYSPVTKTSLTHTKQENIGAIGTGHNVSAKPFNAVNGAVNGAPKLVNKQYNTPLKLYSDQSIAETLSAQAEVLSTGALGVNFKKNEKEYDASKSSVLRYVQEADKEPRAHEAEPDSGIVTTPNLGIAGLRHVPAPETKPPSSNPQLPPGQNICADCERLIVGVFVRIKDKNLHVECFKCATCGSSLKNVGYYNINNKLYCDVHAKLAARNNPPAPNLVPVTVSPGGKAPVNAISAALASHTLPSPSPQSPKLNNYGTAYQNEDDKKGVEISTPKPLSLNVTNEANINKFNNSSLNPTPVSFSNFLNKGNNSSVPRAFSSVSAPLSPRSNTLPRTAPLSPTVPAPSIPSYSPVSSAGRSVNITWPPPLEEESFPTACPLYFPPPSQVELEQKIKHIDEDTQYSQELEEINFMAQFQEPKLSLCSEEVTLITDRKSATECIETITDSLETQKLVENILKSRPQSPPPIMTDIKVSERKEIKQVEQIQLTSSENTERRESCDLKRPTEFTPNTLEHTKKGTKIENTAPQKWESQMVQALTTASDKPYISTDPFSQIPAKRSSGPLASALATAPIEPFTPHQPALQLIPLPDYTEPYLPPEHTFSVEPKEPKPQKPDSQFVKALKVAPERPFTPAGGTTPIKKKKDPNDVYFKDLPKPQEKLSMLSALTTAPDRSYSPLIIETTQTTESKSEEQKETKQTKTIERQTLQRPLKPAVLPESFKPIVEDNPPPPNYPPVFQGFSCSFHNKTDHSEFSVDVCTTPPVCYPEKSQTSHSQTLDVNHVGAEQTIIETETIKEESRSTKQKSKQDKHSCTQKQQTPKIEKQDETVVLKKPLPLAASLHKPNYLPQYQVSLSEEAEADLLMMQKIQQAQARHEQQKLNQKIIEKPEITLTTVAQPDYNPVPTIQAEQSLRSTSQNQFRPLSEARPPSSTFSPRPRSLTPSMINKPPPVLPYYQANLVAQQYSAPTVNLLDPSSPAVSRSPSPCPERREGRSRSPSPFPAKERPKSPAPGPPPNPLQSTKPLPTPQDSKRDEAKRSLSAYIPQYKEKRDLIEQVQGMEFLSQREHSNIAPQIYTSQVQTQNIPANYYQENQMSQVGQSQSSGLLVQEKESQNLSFRQKTQELQSLQVEDLQRERVQASQEGSRFVTTAVSEKAHQEHLEQLKQSESKSVEKSQDGRTQIQRKKTVTEEFEHSHKETNIQIEKNISSKKYPFHDKINPPNDDQPGVIGLHVTNPQPIVSTFLGNKPQVTAQICPQTGKPCQSAVSCQESTSKTQQSCQNVNIKPSPSIPTPTVFTKPETPLPVVTQTPIFNPQVAPKQPIKHVSAPACASSASKNQNVKPSVPLPNTGTGGGRQSGAIGVAPKRGRGILNAGSIGGARIPLCGQCHSQIRGPFITALGKIWCPDHFICATPSCRRPLQDLGFVEERGQLFCEYCFEQYLAPPCSKCNAKIKGDCLKAIGKNFHPECFNCVYCGKLFGNSPFFLEDGSPYCENDWNELFTTKCYACGFPVEAGDRWVEALNNNYHSQCFNCTMCKKNLEGQSFFAKGGRPFCKNHAR